MGKCNYLLGLILLFILLITPISIICAQELWSYDPDKEVELSRYWTVSAITISDDNKFIAVGLYRHYYISSDCFYIEDFETKQKCHIEESKVLLFDISGRLLWEYKTKNKIEGIQFSTNSKYLILNNSRSYGTYTEPQDKIYLFSTEGELLWVYDGAHNGRIGSDNIVLFHYDFPNYENRKTLLVNIEKEIIKEYPDIGIYSANRDLSKVLFTNLRGFENPQVTPEYIGVMSKSGTVLWKKAIRIDGFTRPNEQFISDDGNRVVILEEPSKVSGPRIIYFVDSKGNVTSTYIINDFLLPKLDSSSDGKYSILGYQTNIKAQGHNINNPDTWKYNTKFILFNDSGNIIWESNIESNSGPWSINLCNNKLYILFSIYMNSSTNPYLAIMDRNTGEIINMLDLDTRDICVSPDDTYTVLVRDINKIYLYQTDELINMGDNKTETIDETKSSYPNQLVYVVAIVLVLLGIYYNERKR